VQRSEEVTAGNGMNLATQSYRRWASALQLREVEEQVALGPWRNDLNAFPQIYATQ
jgi:hypothetical protein